MTNMFYYDEGFLDESQKEEIRKLVGKLIPGFAVFITASVLLKYYG